DVAPFAISVAQKCKMSRAVRVVLETFHLRQNTVLVPAKIHDSIVLLVTATLMARSYLTEIIAPGVLRLLFHERCIRVTLVQLRADNLDDRAATWRGRLDFDQCHDVFLLRPTYLVSP